MGSEELWNISARNFVIVAHRASTDGDFNLNDLCSSAGRLDGMLRCINSALFLSHGMRRDTSVHIVLLGPKDPPKILTVSGGSVRYLNPDERSTAALLKRALEAPLGASYGCFVRSTPGIVVTRGGLPHFLESTKGPVFLLDENGVDPRDGHMDLPLVSSSHPSFYILSDDMDMGEEEKETVRSKAASVISVSPLILHADHAVTVLHNILDRMGGNKGV